MSVTVEWANAQKSIVLYTFKEQWGWDEFYARWDWLKTALDASDHPVSIIMDLRGTRYVPPDSFKHLRAILEQIHPNFSRATAYVGLGALSMMYNTVLRQLNPKLVEDYQAFFVPTLEEARVLLDDWNEQLARKTHQKGTP